jgi:alpha-1,6-mannosyltransferase
MSAPIEVELSSQAQPLGAAVAVPVRPALVRVRVRAPVRLSPGPTAIAGLVLAGAALALAAPGTRYLVLAGYGPRLPDWVTGVFGDVGWQASPIALCGLLATMIACYLAALRWSGAITPRMGIGAIVALHATFMLAPPLLSSDVFNYIDAGRLHALYGLNPYLATPLARTGDVAFPYTGIAWAHSASVYGPIFTLLSSALAPLGAAAQLWTLKALTAGASLGCVALVWACARRLGRPPLQAAMFYGLNPIVLVSAVGGAHNDLLMGLLVLLGLAFALRDRMRPAVATLVGAAAIKLTAGLVVPFVLIASGARWRHAALAGIGALAVLAVGAFVLFGTAPMDVVGTLSQGSAHHYGELRSVPGFVSAYAGLGPIGSLARALLHAAGLAAIALLALRAWRGRLPWLTAASWSVVALLLSSTRLEPWYAVWLIPLAAVSTDRRVRGASHALMLAIASIALIRFGLSLGIHYPHGG